MQKLIFSILIILVFLPIEFYFSEQANFTINALMSAGFYLVTCSSILVAILLLIFNKRQASIVVLMIGFLVIVPYNMYYSIELRELKIKGDRIVNWAHQVELETNSFPENLTIESDPRITYVREKDSFIVSFYVTTPTTGHFYTPKDGWGYMDD